MTIETAIQRLKAADPAPETNALRGETDEFAALLLATWQRSTNMQTQEPTRLAPVEEPPTRKWLIAAAVAAATIIVLGAVALLSPSGDSPDVADTPTTVEVEAYDYGFRGLPLELAAGDAIELVNTSPTEYHILVAIRLDDDDARTIEDYAALPPASFGAEIPQPGFSIVGALHAAPGEAACNGRVRLQNPGRYLIIDMVRQGADPAVVDAAVCTSGSDGGAAPYKVPGGPLGYEHGMITIVTVK